MQIKLPGSEIDFVRTQMCVVSLVVSLALKSPYGERSIKYVCMYKFQLPFILAVVTLHAFTKVKRELI